MKICPNCGATQQNHRTFCVDCGERLEKAISAHEEKQVRAEMDAQLEKLYNQRDPLYVSKWDKLGGLLSILCCVALLIVALFIGRWDDAPAVVLFAAVMTLCCVLEAFIPKLTWALERIRLSLYANGTDDLTPSGFYFIMRKLVIWGTVVSNLVLLVIAIVSLFNGPAPEQPNIMID